MEEESTEAQYAWSFWTTELNEMSKQRKQLYVEACKSKSESDIQKHKEFKDTMRKKVRNAKRSIL